MSCQSIDGKRAEYLGRFALFGDEGGGCGGFARDLETVVREDFTDGVHSSTAGKRKREQRFWVHRTHRKPNMSISTGM